MRNAKSHLWPVLIRSCKFFHRFLSSAEPEEILEYLTKLNKQQEEMYQNIMELVIYSEGAISYNELWSMSFYERDQFVKTINKYNAKKNGDNNEML